LPASGQQEKPRIVAVPAVLDRSAVEGLTPFQESTTGGDEHLSIATLSIPGTPSLEKSLQATATKAENAALARRSLGIANELNVTWNPVLAAGPVLGILQTVRTYTGGTRETTTSHAVYADLTSGETWESSALVAQPTRLQKLVDNALAHAYTGRESVRRSAVLQDLRFARDGAVVVVLGQGEGGAESLTEMAVRIPQGESTGLLSEPGKHVQEAAIAQAPFQGVANPVETPTAQPAKVAPPTAPLQPAQTTGRRPVNCAKAKCIALTFDDGPGPYTRRLLKMLAQKKVSATFFLIGGSVSTRPDLVKAEIAAGHAIGNHSWDHPQLTKLSKTRIKDEVDRTARAIQKAAGVSTTLVRPPYGATNGVVASILRSRGDAQILWNVDTEDWKNLNARITTRRALAGARRGGIILMHDIHSTSVDAVPRIIDKLRARGFTLVTVPELFGNRLKPGRRYFNR
jgi:peptidoglycan-N-acetylglucosamine deacetylase